LSTKRSSRNATTAEKSATAKKSVPALQAKSEQPEAKPSQKLKGIKTPVQAQWEADELIICKPPVT
jgi:hypothetical protein